MMGVEVTRVNTDYQKMPRYTRELTSRAIGSKVPASVYAAILKAADERDTTMSRLTLIILTSWLEENNYLERKRAVVG
jgi:hypothetical protein